MEGHDWDSAWSVLSPTFCHRRNGWWAVQKRWDGTNRITVKASDYDYSGNIRQMLSFVRMGHTHTDLLQQRGDFARERDVLALGILDTIKWVQESKETVGRSKHAQAARDRLRHVIDPLLSRRQEHWEELQEMGKDWIEASFDDYGRRIAKDPSP